MDIDSIITEIAEGKMVVVSDHPDRENEADLIVAADQMTVEQMAFMIRYTSGIITVPMRESRLQELRLERLQSDTPATFDTPFVMPVDFLPSTRGGVSAQERISTIRALIDPQTRPSDLGRPGHVFPLQAHSEGLQARAGHTEAGMYLVEQAGRYPAAVIGELINDDGTMMAGDALTSFVQEHGFAYCSIQDMIDSL
jgi:3,4-dihydroxy 2-butanone 4-phosphate synthase/GTP cyclohydrolase II